MAKRVADAVLDAALNYIKTNGGVMTACSAEPTTYTQATALSTGSGYRLATTNVTATFYTGPADHTTGRKITTAARLAVPVTESGTNNYTHVAICATAGSGTLLYVTTGTTQAVTGGNTVDFPAWIISIADPT